MESKGPWPEIGSLFEEISRKLEVAHVPTENELDASKIAAKYPGLVSTSMLAEKRTVGYLQILFHL